MSDYYSNKQRFPNFTGYNPPNHIIYAVATDYESFRDALQKDDLEKAKELCNSGKDTYPITDSDVKLAGLWGSLKCLKWLVEELGVIPDEKAIPYSLEQNQHESVIYLIKQNAPIEGSTFLCNNNLSRHKILPLSEMIQEKYRQMGIFYLNGMNPLLGMLLALLKYRNLPFYLEWFRHFRFGDFKANEISYISNLGIPNFEILDSDTPNCKTAGKIENLVEIILSGVAESLGDLYPIQDRTLTAPILLKCLQELNNLKIDEKPILDAKETEPMRQFMRQVATHSVKQETPLEQFERFLAGRNWNIKRREIQMQQYANLQKWIDKYGVDPHWNSNNLGVPSTTNDFTLEEIHFLLQYYSDLWPFLIQNLSCYLCKEIDCAKFLVNYGDKNQLWTSLSQTQISNILLDFLSGIVTLFRRSSFFRSDAFFERCSDSKKDKSESADSKNCIIDTPVDSDSRTTFEELDIRSYGFKSFQVKDVIDIWNSVLKSSGWTDKIRWVDIQNRTGLYESKFIRCIINKVNLASLVTFDFSDPLPEDYKETEVWWGIGLLEKESTYAKRQYIKHPIDQQFAEIKTITDVEDNIKFLSETISSPTGCYFKIDREHNIFYRDSQDCVIWAINPDDNRVYIFNDDDIYNKEYVAKSVPEFLSHMNDDSNAYSNTKWRSGNSYTEKMIVALSLYGKDASRLKEYQESVEKSEK